MTQAALAKEAHTAQRTIIAIENHQRHPSHEVFYRIIRVLEISADYIFWPEKAIYTPEQGQVIQEFLNCSEREQDIIISTMRTLIRSLRGTCNY